MKVTRVVSAILAMSAILTLAACENGGNGTLGKMFQKKPKSETASASARSGKTIEQEVEAPDVFSVADDGLWDGRPSLGGVWVAHADVKDPERVIIRNTDNGKFVVGALFRRERAIPGPKLQISSDAAEALGMLAGAPAKLNVVALRREKVSEEPETTPVKAATVAKPTEVSETSLDPIAAAGAAIDTANSGAAAQKPTPPEAKPASKAASNLTKPYLQVGIFSVQSNANRAAKQMRGAGMVPIQRRGETGGKPFWRVIVGPAATKSERSKLLSQIKAEGFTDAYPVTN